MSRSKPFGPQHREFMAFYRYFLLTIFFLFQMFMLIPNIELENSFGVICVVLSQLWTFPGWFRVISMRFVSPLRNLGVGISKIIGQTLIKIE